MKQKAYAIYDSKLAEFNTPFFSPNNNTAIRTFTDAANDPTTNINRHPEDFSLHHIGTYETDNGQLTPDDHHNLGLASEYKHDITQP